jgi:hypothetical protein
MSIDILRFVTQYSFYSGFIIFVLGVTGNALNILVFTQLKLFRDNRSVFYLTVESTASFFYQFVQISITILTLIYGNDATELSRVWCKFRYILPQTFALITYYTICLAAVDQFFSINYLFNRRQMCTLKLAQCLTFAFVCLWIVHSTVSGLFFDIQPSVGCAISNAIWLQYSTYFFYPFLIGFLPITIASLFSILAYRNVRRIVRRQLPIVRRRLDRQMTAMVLMRVIIFVCFSFPYVMYRVYIINFPIPQTDLMEYAIGRLVQAVFLTVVSLNYTVSYHVNKFTFVTFSFILLDELLCVCYIIITFSSSGEICFGEKMLATMQILLLLPT